jgi:hypothetical protein
VKTDGEIADRVTRSQELLSAAVQQWDAADLTACGNVCRRLEEAIAELELAKRRVGEVGSAGPAVVLRLGWIRNDAARLTRLIDAAHSYRRAVHPCSGAASSTVELGEA